MMYDALRTFSSMSGHFEALTKSKIGQESMQRALRNPEFKDVFASRNVVPSGVDPDVDDLDREAYGDELITSTENPDEYPDRRPTHHQRSENSGIESNTDEQDRRKGPSSASQTGKASISRQHIPADSSSQEARASSSGVSCSAAYSGRDQGGLRTNKSKGPAAGHGPVFQSSSAAAAQSHGVASTDTRQHGGVRQASEHPTGSRPRLSRPVTPSGYSSGSPSRYSRASSSPDASTYTSQPRRSPQMSGRASGTEGESSYSARRGAASPGYSGSDSPSPHSGLSSPWGVGVRPNLVQEPGRRGMPNNVTSPQSRISIASVARQSAQSRRTLSPTSSAPGPSSASTTNQPRSSRRQLPDPYSDPRYLPKRLPKTQTDSRQAAAATQNSEVFRPSSSSAQRRAINPAAFERLAAGLSATVQEQRQRPASTAGALQHPQQVKVATRRRQKQSRPAWVAAGAAAAAAAPIDNEASHLARVLNNSNDTSDQVQLAEAQRPRSTSPSSWTEQGFVSNSYARVRHSSDISHQYYDRFRVKQHREDMPSYRFSQPRSYGPHEQIHQKAFQFDEAHPALAEQHYLRSPEQNLLLEKERLALAAAAQAERQGRSTEVSPSRASPSGQKQKLVEGINKLSKSRDDGNDRLKELQKEGEILRRQSMSVQQRAMEAIAASERITQQQRVTSPGRPSAASPGAAAGAVMPLISGVDGGRIRSRSPPGVYRTDAYSRTTFGAPPGARNNKIVQYTEEALQQQLEKELLADKSFLYPNDGFPATQEPVLDIYGDKSAVQRPAEYLHTQYTRSLPPGSHIDADLADRLPQYGMLYGIEQGSTKEAAAQAGEKDRLVSLADHLAAASPPRASVSAMPILQQQTTVSAVLTRTAGPALTTDEMLMASGAFNPDKYNEYNRQVDMEMERRALEQGGYDSDLDREDEVMQQGLPLGASAEEQDALKIQDETWDGQNEWMDFYRKRFGPEDGYGPHHHSADRSGQRSTQSSPGGMPQYLVDYNSPGDSGRPYLSDQEEAMLDQPYIPNVWKQLPTEAMAAAQARHQSPHTRGQKDKKKWHVTVPLEPFDFEIREKQKPKPIVQVKLEQDLQLKRNEEEAARSYQFKSRPVPHSNAPMYEQMTIEREVRRQIRLEHRIQELQSSYEKVRPFTFLDKEQERLMQREEAIKAAKDPNRFQIKFRAKELPKSIKGDEYKRMMLELENKRAETRHRIERARAEAKARAAEEDRQRRTAADEAYKDRLQEDKMRAVDPIWNQKYETKPLGMVPDFDRLHREHEMELTRIRSNTRRQITVPHEFKLNGSTPTEQHNRDRKALERRQRIILDMQLDAELLPEMRWPHRMPRGRVRTAPGAALEPSGDFRVGETRASILRKGHIRISRRHGQYDFREEREQKTLEDAKIMAQKRAKAWIQAKKAAGSSLQEVDIQGGISEGAGGSRSASGDSGRGPSGPLSLAARRKLLEARDDAPAQYIEARHMQAERRAQQIVEDALMQQGLDAYKYREG
ncbi:hypothetical protein CEUSTIGMA_g473.t1 [Chlamydomonas eustigma]|uniref:Uncharacterized protein n=1 Tax=Chlamydomonas eustigma TaxID=1157962 RepID=A0A250WQF0_9CHLO|nr:hypothetical protein CEUSTIGMA_g473.t1 [Chlamydomonas eustigma]|eukprot:GAX73021.1 hypothetical protein CEUSTIGMA_g473.t1 [Chlamydomonas eustigma]